MENLYEKTKFILKKYGISANKKLGQNFLINDEVVDKIVESSEITKNDLIIEIGPGLGNLTEFLLEKAKNVVAIELDDRMMKILKDRFLLYDNLEIINQDILKVDLAEIINNYKKEKQIQDVKIVANLPYYITTPIIMKLLEDKLDIKSITVMIQKEVADRLVAKPGEKLSGAITYSVYYYSLPESIMIVNKDSFIPQPEVSSEVIKLNIRKEPPVNVIDEKNFFNLIKVSFMQRRKTLMNSLINGKVLKNRNEATKVFNDLKIDNNIRGEKLSIQDFANISNYIVENKI